MEKSVYICIMQNGTATPLTHKKHKNMNAIVTLNGEREEFYASTVANAQEDAFVWAMDKSMFDKSEDQGQLVIDNGITERVYKLSHCRGGWPVFTKKIAENKIVIK